MVKVEPVWHRQESMRQMLSDGKRNKRARLSQMLQHFSNLPLGIADSFPKVSFKALKRMEFFSSASFSLFCVLSRLSSFSIKNAYDTDALTLYFHYSFFAHDWIWIITINSFFIKISNCVNKKVQQKLWGSLIIFSSFFKFPTFIVSKWMSSMNSCIYLIWVFQRCAEESIYNVMI